MVFMDEDAGYVQLYRVLRERITEGVYEVGQRLPSISDLQAEFEVRSLTTVRAAQQMLVEEGMLRTEHGRGAFVIAREPAGGIDVAAVIEAAQEQLRLAQFGIQAQRANRVLIDLNDPGRPLTHHVLTTALADYAAKCRRDADGVGDDEAESLRAQAGEADQLTVDVESAAR